MRGRGDVVLERKTGPFQPYACKLNFYLTAADDLLRDRVVAEYALKDTQRPITVSAWQLTISQRSTVISRRWRGDITLPGGDSARIAR